MDGVFMRKMFGRLLFCVSLAAAVWLCALITDKQTLRQELVRLHVVAASDSAEDQAMKLHLKNAIVDSLPKIESLANQVLQEAGCQDTATVRLAVEEFSTRVYDTFTLPAGVYDALRITIGEGEGKNWWCVVFPSLCLPATAEGVEDAASCAGFSDSLTAALEGAEGYEIRFWLLDALGRIENLLHRE